ncbi:MAG: PilZ domain-containing protein, partial [Shewanella sp.]
MTIQGFKELRQSVRIDMEASDIGVFWLEQGQEHSLIAKHADISRFGTSFISSTNFPLGCNLLIALQPSKDSVEKIPAKVCRVEPQQQLFLIAVEFEQK